MSIPWSSTEKAQLRAYLGNAAIFRQWNTALDNAILAVQSMSDGGSRPDDGDQLLIRVWMGKIASIETKIEALYCQLPIEAAGKDNVRLDAARALVVLKSQGKMLIGRIAHSFSINPIHDYFGQAEIGVTGESGSVFLGSTPDTGFGSGS